MTPEHVAQIRSVTDVKISPDGKQVAYVLSVPRKLFQEKDGPAWTQLHVVDQEGNSRPYVSGDVNVSGVDWTPDGRYISFLAKRGDDKEKSLYVIPLAGGEARQVLQHPTSISSYSWNPDGRHVTFIATEEADKEKRKLKDQGFNQQVFEEDWRAKKVWIVELDLSSEAAEPEKKPRVLDIEGSASTVKWSPRGDLIAAAVAPTPFVDDFYMNREIHIIDPENGEIQGQIQPPGKMGGFVWSPDGEHIALLAGFDRHDPDPGRLAVSPAAGGELKYVLPEFKGQFTSLAWKNEDTIVYLAQVGVTSRLGEISRQGTAHQVTIPEDEGFVFRSFSKAREGSQFAFRSSAADHPTEVFSWARGDEPPRRLTHSNPWLDEVRLARQEVVSFKARDGLGLQGILVRPLDYEQGKRYPLIVGVHGGPESHIPDGWTTSYSYLGQAAAARGFAVIYPNYRGSTGRGVEFSKLSQGDFAGKEFDDLVDAVDHLADMGLADKDRVGITGGSYGGYATAWGATYYTDRYAAAVMFVGISDTISKAATTDIPQEIYFVHQRHRIWDDWQTFLERSPIYYVEQARTPLLILHGENDTRVHPAQSLELYRLLKMLGQTPVRLVLYPGEGHGNRRAASRYDYNLRSLRWMEHYLKGPGGDPPPYEIDYGQPGKTEENEALSKRE